MPASLYSHSSGVPATRTRGASQPMRAEFDALATAFSTLAGGAGSANIGYTPAGTGAVATTVQNKLREEVSTQDNDTVANSLLAAAGRRLHVLGGDSLISSQITPSNNTAIGGDGAGSNIQTTTTNHHLININADGGIVKDLSISGVKGSTVLNNSAIVFQANYGAADRVRAFGMSGMAMYLTSSSDISVSFSRIHGLTPDTAYINGADIASYSDNEYGRFVYNTLEGGADTECGVLMQLNSIKNIVHGNTIKAHSSYGVLDYDVTPVRTDNIISMNRIEDIDGADFGGAKGAGIYIVNTGGQIVACNNIKNTNIGTTTESLAPAGIGINAPSDPVSVIGNNINDANWYGVMVVSSTVAVNFSANIVTEANKGSVYVKSSSHANVHGGVYEQLSATPLTVRGIAVNVAGGGTFTGVSVHGNKVRGSSRAVECAFTNYSLVNNNNISEVNGIGIRLTDGTGLACVGNVVNVTGSAAAALDVSNVTHATISGNVFKGTVSTIINFAGTCTGTRFDKSNILVGMTANNINNAATGCIVETYGTVAPTVLNHQVGDRVQNSSPAVGQPKGWVCTVAGVPGTWVSEGNL